VASLPVEVEDLGEGGVDRVIGDEARARWVGSIADTELGVDVEDGLRTAGSKDGGGEVEFVSEGVVVAFDGTSQSRVCSGLCQLTLEVVGGLLVGGDLVIKLIVATVVNISNSEGEARGHVDSEGQLAVLAVLGDGDARASAGLVLRESDSDRGVVCAENVLGGASRASTSVNDQLGDVEALGSGGGSDRGGGTDEGKSSSGKSEYHFDLLRR